MQRIKQGFVVMAALLMGAARAAAPESRTASRPAARLFFSLQWKDSARGYAQIYSMKPDGTDRICLTPGFDAEYHPAVSPDGKTIAFSTHRDGTRSLYLMNPDGTNQHQLTRDGDAGLCAWSPDGKHLTFSSNRTGLYCIYTMNADGANVRKLTDGPAEDCPVWSPDGRKIAFEGRQDNIWRVYVVDADGANLRAITTDKWDNRWPQWSPDSKLLAYTGYEQGSGDIYTMRPDGTRITRQTDSHGEARQPAWSGKQLLFHSNRAGHFDIYTLKPGSHDEHRLTAESKDTEEVTSAFCVLPPPSPRPDTPAGRE